MQKNKTLKGLLAVSAVAAMFSAFGAQAQTGSSSTAAGQNVGQTGTGTGGQSMPNKSGKTNSAGAMGNTNSTGMESRPDSASSSMSQSGASGASGASAAGGKLSSGDEKALKDMAQADVDEVAAGKIALTKAQSSEVKSFAQQMVDDHGQALTKVQAVAQQKGVTLPTEPDATHKAMAAKLEKMSGDAFDKAYMQNGGVKDHKTVLSKLKSDAKKIKDPDVKAVADQHVSVVEQHLKAAEQMASNKSGTTSGK